MAAACQANAASLPPDRLRRRPIAARAGVIFAAGIAMGLLQPHSERVASAQGVVADRSVVFVEVPASMHGVWAPTNGTGFVVASDAAASYVVTAAHVMGCNTYGYSCRKDFFVRLPQAFKQPVAGQLLYAGASNDTEDYAILRIPVGGLTPVRLGEAANAAGVAALGFPLTETTAFRPETMPPHLEPTLRSGSVTDVRSAGRHLVVGVRTAEGDSGGPIFAPGSGAVVDIVRGAPPGDSSRETYAVGTATVSRVISGALAGATTPRSNVDDAKLRAYLLFEYAHDVAEQADYIGNVMFYDSSHHFALLSQAGELYSEALAAGSLDAAIDLVRPLETGGTLRLVPRNVILSTLKSKEDVFAALRAASASGDARASFALGNYARAAFDHRQNAADAGDALRYFRLAANQGDARAMALLAEFSYLGALSLPADPAVAAGWARRAEAPLKRLIASGDAEAAYRYAQMIELSQPGGFSARTIEPVVVRNYVKAADLGSDLALARLQDKFLWEVEGGPALQREIFAVFKKALDAGKTGGYFGMLAGMYEYGSGTQADKRQALVAYLAAGAAMKDGSQGVVQSGLSLVQNSEAIRQAVPSTRGFLIAVVSTVRIKLSRTSANEVAGVVVGARGGNALIATAAFDLGCDSFGNSCIEPAAVEFANGAASTTVKILRRADTSLENGVVVLEANGANALDASRFDDVTKAFPEIQERKADALFAPVAQPLPDMTSPGPENAVVTVGPGGKGGAWGVLLGADADRRVIDLFLPFPSDGIGRGLFELRTGRLVGIYTDPWHVTQATGPATIVKALAEARSG
jgi:TPR repeat protein